MTDAESMVERVSRAMDPDVWFHFAAYCRIKDYSPEEAAARMLESAPVQRSLLRARAAIEAMREATNEMCEAGSLGPLEREGFPIPAITTSQADACWEAMISTALKEDAEKP